MSKTGEIDLKEVKARYSVKDIRFVDSREIDFANEFRTTYEVSFGIGLTLLGNLISNFSWVLAAVTFVFLGFGIFNLVRYSKKQEDIKNDSAGNITPVIAKKP